MEEKKLIFVDNAAASNFLGEVEDVLGRCNELLRQFNELQPWKKITTVQDWIQLVKSPEAFYDKILLANIKLSESAGLQPNLEILAKLYDIPRENFMNIVKGISFNTEECVPCKKSRLKITRGKPAVTLVDYKRNEDFLIFSPEGFTRDDERVKQELKKFEVYAETEAEQEVVDYWETLAKMFNAHLQKGFIGPVKLEECAKSFGLRFVDNQVYVNHNNLFWEILKLRKNVSVSQ